MTRVPSQGKQSVRTWLDPCKKLTFDDTLLRKRAEIAQLHIPRWPPLRIFLQLVADRLLRFLPPRDDSLERFTSRSLQLQSDRLAYRALDQGRRFEGGLALDKDAANREELVTLQRIKFESVKMRQLK